VSPRAPSSPAPRTRAVSGEPRPTALRRYLPDPARLWICCCPRSWPGAGGLWCHLAERRLGAARPGGVPRIDPRAVDDLVYLPPVDEEHRAARDEVARELERASVPLLTQRRPGEAGGREEDVLDLLETLLVAGGRRLGELETTLRAAVWPLIPGLTDDPDEWEVGLAALARAGLETVLPLPLALEPADCRRLAEFTDEAGYQALFHGRRPDGRAFARAAARRGLGAFPRRPELAGSPRARFSRRAAAELAHVAELWLGLGRSEAAGQELLRASRWLDRSPHDLEALAREGNLDVLPWLGGESRRVVEDLAAGRPASLRRELEEEYLAP